jgi:hypothetical protein
LRKIALQTTLHLNLKLKIEVLSTTYRVNIYVNMRIMEQTFNPSKYISQLGEQLVAEFANAGIGTHTQAVGSAREKSAISKLRTILPSGIGVGSGFVFDSHGNTSKQCDIIIYEKDFALKFAISDDEQNTYYNCENVIAVGEVKSDASIADIRDSIKKLKVIRELKRFIPEGYHGYRPYLSSLPTVWAPGGRIPEDDFNSLKNYQDQIFTFLLCKSLNSKLDSINNELKTICGDNKYLYPNRLLSANNDYFTYANVDFNIQTPQLQSYHFSAMDSNAFTHIKTEQSFNRFVTELMLFIRTGHSVPENKEIYLNSEMKATAIEASRIE